MTHMTDVLARHAEAYGDEHDEDCPLCGVDAQRPATKCRKHEWTWAGTTPDSGEVCRYCGKRR